MTQQDMKKCREESCQKKVLNVSGFCIEHRRKKCGAFGCKETLSGRHLAKFCVKHKDRIYRSETGWEAM